MTGYAKKSLILVCITIVVVACTPSTNFSQRATRSDSTSSTMKVGIVKNRDSFDGAGCSLQMPTDYQKHNDRCVFLSDFEDNATININGKDIKLKLVGRREPEREPRNGDRSVFNYATQRIKVRVDFLVTGVCDPNDESCEVTYYDATLTITRGRTIRMVRTKGICGT